jgi:hypothetical protein
MDRSRSGSGAGHDGQERFKSASRPLVPSCQSLANPLPFTHTSLFNDVGGFMSAARFRNFQFGLMLATAISLSLLPTAGHAYTQDEQQACTGDAFRLCGPEIPDVDRVTVCMIRNKSQLSPGCRVFFRPSEDERAPDRAGRPLSIRPATAHRPVHTRPHKSKKAKPAAT